MSSRKEKIIKIYIYGILSLSTIALVVMVYWSFWPYKTIVQSPKPFNLVGNDYADQGGTISYEYDYCKFTDVKATVSKQFVDGLIFQSEDVSTVLEEGCGHVHREIKIPKTLPAGKYKLKITATYKVNPIRSIIIDNETEWFYVNDPINPNRNY